MQACQFSYGLRGKTLSFSDEIRYAILNCGQSAGVLCEQLGMQQSVMSRFLNGQGGLSTPMLDALAELLGLHVTTDDTKREMARDPEGGWCIKKVATDDEAK